MKENNEKKETLEGSIDRINSKRRSFAKTGIAVPVIMTLASRPVFGAQCLSEMLSTTMSGSPGNHCWGGQSPGFWKALTGATDNGVSAVEAWSRTGYFYGTLNAGGNVNKWNEYTGGTLFATIFGNHPDTDGKTLREVLNLNIAIDIEANPDDDGLTYDASKYDKVYFHLIAGLLNAKFFENDLTMDDSYMFSVKEFWAMYGDASKVPGNMTLDELISTNYHNNP
mgnify:CR=1 FL=1